LGSIQEKKRSILIPMKTSLLTIVALCAVELTAFAQGRVAFNNSSTFSPSDAITIGAVNQGTSGGLAGQGIGGNQYSVQLVWVAGTGLSQAAFDAGVQTSSQPITGVGGGGSPTAAFLANTGSMASGAGFFDAGIIPNPIGTSMPGGGYTMQVLAWYSVGLTSYNQALAAGKNLGKSALFNMTATVIAPVNPTVFPAFVVGVPEPSSLALAGLGAVAMLLLRRKK
jgi:hypothetical protein